MKLLILLLLTEICLSSCKQAKIKKEYSLPIVNHAADTIHSPTYNEVLVQIEKAKAGFLKKYEGDYHKLEIMDEIRNYWIDVLGQDLYKQWESTPWDFNGTTRVPKQGNIACGYFVTTILLDMGYKLNRIKLSTCDAMTMMKSLTPGQRIQNLSYLDYESFNKKIKDAGKAVYIIGLDYHTGLLINDGTETWFLHSNYINKEGVIKERISESLALKTSGSRFTTCLTSDKNFLLRWITQ